MEVNLDWKSFIYGMTKGTMKFLLQGVLTKEVRFAKIYIMPMCFNLGSSNFVPIYSPVVGMSLQISKPIVLAEAKLRHFKGQYLFEHVYGHQVQYVGPSGLKNVLQIALTITFHKLILIFLYLEQVLSNVEENKNILLFFFPDGKKFIGS